MPLHFDRDPSPSVYHDGLVIVAPADTPDVFAFDAETGKTVWTNRKSPTLRCCSALWAKARRQRQPPCGPRLYTGRLVGFGRKAAPPASAEWAAASSPAHEIFWPTRTEIYVFDADSGTRTRSPISLSPVSDCGANLAAADGRLIVAGYDKLLAFGPPTAGRIRPTFRRAEAVRTSRLSPAQLGDR